MNGNLHQQLTLMPGKDSTGSSLGTECCQQKKRRLEEDAMVQDCCNNYNGCQASSQSVVSCRSFLPLKASGGIYQTEEWKGADTLYLPLTDDTLLNIRMVEQFTFSSGMHFVADAAGNYSATMAGNLIHIWKHNPTSLKMCISRSIFFTNMQLFEEARNLLLQL